MIDVPGVKNVDTDRRLRTTVLPCQLAEDSVDYCQSYYPDTDL